MELIIDDELDSDKFYTIKFIPGDVDHELFISSHTGEGMSMSEKNLFDILDEYFKREF